VDCFVKMENFLESIRSRSRIPSEIFCTLSFTLYFSITACTAGLLPPFELFGHIYVRPSDDLTIIYQLLVVFCVCALIIELFKVIRRCLLLRHGDFAVLMPCIIWPTSAPTYKQGGGRVVLSFVISLSLVFSAIVFLFITPWMSPILGGMAGLGALNIALSVANPVRLRKRRPKWYNICQVLTVLVTAREYGNLKLEEKKWNPAEIEYVTDLHSRSLANQTACALFAADDGEDLVVFGSGDIGHKGNWNRMVHVDKGVDFRIVMVRLPYSLVWYSVYSVMAANVRLVGADEIDKCLLWLGIVSLISEIIVRWNLGPGMVVAVR